MENRFRKKPVEIKAIQWTGNVVELRKFVGKDGYYFKDGDKLYIKTLEGQHLASKNDWIIRGIKGEFYPCKPDIFELTYESLTPTKEPRVSAKEWILKTHGHCDDKDKMNLTFEELCEELESFFATQVERVSTEEIKKRAKEYADKHFRSDVSEKDNWDCEITFIDGFKEGLSSKQGEKPTDSWIKCSDRLPEKDGLDPITCDLKHDYSEEPMRGYYDEGTWWIEPDGMAVGHRSIETFSTEVNITHWQPLPEAPEKEKKGN